MSQCMPVQSFVCVVAGKYQRNITKISKIFQDDVMSLARSNYDQRFPVETRTVPLSHPMKTIGLSNPPKDLPHERKIPAQNLLPAAFLTAVDGNLKC